MNYLFEVMTSFCYHRHNAAKARVLLALFDKFPYPLTSLQISESSGMDYGNTRRLLSHYADSPSHYIRRLKKKGENGAYRYLINKKGVRYLTEYLQRMKLGLSLGLRRRYKIKYMSTYTGHRSVKLRKPSDYVILPEEIAPYIQLTRAGAVDMGLKYEDRLKIVGIIKDDKEAAEDRVQDKEKRKRGRPRKNALEPSAQKAGDKPLLKKEKSFESNVKSQNKAKCKEAGHESKKKYTLPDLPEELTYPEKEYIFGNEILTSRELAEICVFAINKINKELKKTIDGRNRKKLTDKKRLYLMYLMNEDIKQFVTVK